MAKQPKQLRDQIKLADRLIKENIETPTEIPEETPPVEGAAPQQELPLETPTETPVETPPAETNVVDITPVETPEETPQETFEGDNWEQKYRTLQGKYDSELTRMDTDLRELREQNAGLYHQNEQAASLLQEYRQALASKPPAEEKPLTSEQTFEIPANIVEEYGEDMINVMKQAGRVAVSDEIESLRKKQQELETLISKQNQNVGQLGAEQQNQRMFSIMDAEVPGWRTFNEQPGFLNWVREVDPVSGYSLQQVLTQAWDMGDITRVIAIFRSYLERQTAPDPTPVEPEPKPRLEDVAAPSTQASGAAVGESGDKPKWTRAGITRFYSDVQKGVFKGRDEERLRLERDIIRAISDNEVTG